jgi:hypothetical protein
MTAVVTLLSGPVANTLEKGRETLTEGGLAVVKCCGVLVPPSCSGFSSVTLYVRLVLVFLDLCIVLCLCQWFLSQWIP